MSDTLNLANSIWRNGMKVDSDGRAVFYPLGTKKIKVPTSSTQWPKGNKLVSPFVYQDDKLVGFIDTKALTVSKNTTIFLPYEHIEAAFSAIEKGQLQIHAPNATTKKVSWKNSGVEDIPEVQFKYKGCKTVDDVSHGGYYDYVADIANGTWSEPLWDLTDGTFMFSSCTNLTSFNSDLPSLTNGSSMFYNTNLTSFNSDLPSLKYSEYMFMSSDNLVNFTSDLPSLLNSRGMFSHCYNLTSFNADLSNLTFGESMFHVCENLTSFSSDLSSLTDGKSMFRDCFKLASFTSDLSNLTNGDGMFMCCYELTAFNVDLPSLTEGSYMFTSCRNFTSFSSNLSSLTDGYWMFNDCNNLSSFSSDLSNLTHAEGMFNYCGNLKSFNSNLSSLTDGPNMFCYCYELTAFNVDLPSLTNGNYMFGGCTNLTSFSSNLSSLTEAYGMFNDCKLDTASVKNIIDTINTVSSGGLLLGMGCDDTTEDKDLFAQEVGYADMTSLLAALQAKGWTVTAQYTGRPTTTYGLRRPSENTLPVFVKLEEVEVQANELEETEEQTNELEKTKEYADYTSLDNSKKYRLNWFHETTGSTDGYTQFKSLEEAIETLNIKPIENQ